MDGPGRACMGRDRRAIVSHLINAAAGDDWRWLEATSESGTVPQRGRNPLRLEATCKGNRRQWQTGGCWHRKHFRNGY